MNGILPVVAFVGLRVGLAVTFLLRRGRLMRPSRPTFEEASRRCLERLQNRDFAAVERHFGRPLPGCVREW